MTTKSQIQKLIDSRTGAQELLDDMVHEHAKELETLVKQAHELLSGEWEPDDVDRHKFLTRLARAIP